MERNDQIDFEKGIADIGDLSRMRRLMERAEQGEELVIGFIGGSITQGSLSSAPQLCYAHRVYEWWCRQFPKSQFTYVNAGIGGTTSQFGVARVDSDLLEKKPDFVVIEFSVNDESTEHFMETYEGLVRKICGMPHQPAVLLVHNVRYDDGGNAQVMHGRIGRHYQLPAVSMQSSIYPKVVSGQIPNRDITPDDLHPNDQGHARVASVITYFLEQVCSGRWGAEETECGEQKKYQDKGALPAPLTENAYEHSVRYRNSYAPTGNAPEKSECRQTTGMTEIGQTGGEWKVWVQRDGFVEDDAPQRDITDCFKYGWTAAKTDASITFSVEGSGIAVQYRKSVRQPAPIAEVIVDGDTAHAKRLDANFEETWGDKLELDTILAHGENRMHQVEIRLVETHEDDVVPFYLVSVIASH